MNSKERVMSALNYSSGRDRLPCKFFATPEVISSLMAYVGASDFEQLLCILGDDTREVGPIYCGPELKRLSPDTREGRWGEVIQELPDAMGSYGEVIYKPYKDIETVEQVYALRFPEAGWYDYSTIAGQCDKYKDYAIIAQSPGNMDFINGISLYRGVEQVLIDIATDEPVYAALAERRFTFLYEQSERILQAGDGKIDILWCGEDLGNQNGLLISPKSFDKLLAGYYEKIFALAHKYGAKSMMHSCGSVYRLIPRLIELGLDILDVVQVDCVEMDIRKLHKEFYGKLCFSGSISVQSTLPFGTQEDIVREVNLRKELFRDGGMIIAPTHNIQVGTPMENIVAMYKAIGSYNIDINI